MQVLKKKKKLLFLFVQNAPECLHVFTSETTSEQNVKTVF